MVAENPADDPVFNRFKFYTANPKLKLNRRKLIRTNSIYDDGSDPADQRRAPIVEALTTLLENITLHCYNHILEASRTKWENALWFVIHVLNGVFFGYIITNQFEAISSRPLITSLQDIIYPVKYVPFPAVAICSNNRISLSAATKLAEHFSAIDPKHRNVTHFLNSIHLLGTLYDNEVENENPLLEFQEFLEAHYLDNSTDLTEMIRGLTPQCEDMAIACHWAGEPQGCMTSTENNTAILRQRRTQYGFCCSFNYNRLDNFSMASDVPRFETLVTGPELSLILTMNVSREDIFFNLNNGPGFRVLIFEENDYPDSLSGGVDEVLIIPGSETLVRVDPVTVESSSNILQYGIETRGCLYPSEMKNQFGGDYKRSTCLLKCRIRSLLALCGCIPFYYHLSAYFPDDIQDPPSCTLQNVACLQKYKIKLQMIVTKIESIVGLEREMEEGLYCPECIPSCSSVSYGVKTTTTGLIPQDREGTVLPNTIENISDIAIIRVFFGNSETWLFNQDLSQYWFEIASTFGGLFGLTAGFSIISGLELIHFILNEAGIRIWRNIKNLLPKRIHQPEAFIIYP